jgi:hypothetical protein
MWSEKHFIEILAAIFVNHVTFANWCKTLLHFIWLPFSYNLAKSNTFYHRKLQNQIDKLKSPSLFVKLHVPTQTHSVILCNVFNSLSKLSCKYCNLFSAVAEDLHQNCIKLSGFTFTCCCKLKPLLSASKTGVRTGCLKGGSRSLSILFACKIDCEQTYKIALQKYLFYLFVKVEVPL